MFPYLALILCFSSTSLCCVNNAIKHICIKIGERKQNVVIIETFFTYLNNFDNVRYKILIFNKPLWDQNIFAGISFS